MAEKLVIVESPAKAKTIGRFLGRGYKIEASMGHVIDLPKSQIGIDVENSFKPKYITIRGKGKILQRLKKAAKKSEDVFLATDPDREGEAISWHLARALKINEDQRCRIEFNEITERAITRAVKSPREIDKNLVNAQQARRILDRLVGYKLSPLLWKKVRKGLSAGRVQSVALRIICEREEEIDKFEPEEYWTLIGSFKTEKGDNFEAKLHRIKGEKFTLGSDKEALEAEQAIKGADSYPVKDVKKKKRRKNPFPPFTTSSLQQRAASVLNFSAKKTMYIAQQLYEGLELGQSEATGLITYIRTDSTRVSREAEDALRSYIGSSLGKKYLSEKPRRYASGDSSQDAHEAIRPTSVNRIPDSIKKHLSRDQYRLYKLIWENFVASQMKAALYEQLRIDILAGDDHLFRARGSRLLFPGFLKVDSSRKQKKDQLLPAVKKDELLELLKINSEQNFTQPPPRYTEASLVKALEEKGVGRPSTYAPTLGTIQQRGYVNKEGKSLQPTELGVIVIDLLTQHFPDVTDIEFTARLEERLDSIEEGDDSWVRILSDFYTPFSTRLEKAQEEMQRVQLEEEVTDEKCEKCGENLVVKHGRYGKFLACPGYPDCKFTKPYLKKMGVECPQCQQGEMVERRSRKGRTFYGCSAYPDCEFVSWNRPLKEDCPQCGSFLVEVNRKKGNYQKCSKKECGWRSDQ